MRRFLAPLLAMSDLVEMKTPRSGSLGRRAAVAILSASLLGLSLAGTALAVAPDNDDIGSPRVVTAPLPYSDGPYDTTEATNGPTDAGFCYAPEIGPDAATVWYSFTPDVSDHYGANTFGSDYDTTLYVGTSDGSGGITVIDCNDDAGGDLQSAVQWDGEAGIEYLLMVGTCCGPSPAGGGNLVFNLDVTVGFVISLSVDSTGKVNPRTGEATVSGVISCSSEEVAGVSVQLTQVFGRFVVRGFGEAEVSCGPTPSAWEVPITDTNGRFSPGKATVDVQAFACGPIFCDAELVSTRIRLRSSR